MQGVYKLQPESVRTGTVQTYRCANLNVELAGRIPVVHGVESGDLVYTHWWHLQYPRNLVHDADASEAVLALAEIEEWHNGGLLVLGRVARDNLLDELLVLRGELEWDVRIVLRCIAVLRTMLVLQLQQYEAAKWCIRQRASRCAQAAKH
jgi:hypothetical protein